MTFTLRTIRMAAAGLVLAGVLDLALTLVLMHIGYATEGNPVTANVLSLGVPSFITVKLASLFGFQLVVEWYAKAHPARAFTLSMTTLLFYPIVYCCAFFRVN